MYVQLKKRLMSAHGEMWLEVDFKADTGDFIVLTGPSGSGKSTILRILAGLETVQSGCIQIENAYWLHTDNKIALPPQQRGIGFVFQDYSLFPNMTVLQNLRYALHKNQSVAEIDELIDIMELHELIHRFPDKLSGGQKQRVALARALVPHPKLLLLDEPLSALDPPMRRRLQDYIMDVHKRYKLTTIMVTHDRNEVLKMADTVIFLQQGKIVKMGSPRAVFYPDAAPADPQVTGFVVEVDKQNQAVHIRVGDQLVSIPLSPEANVKPGDQILLKIHQA